jgi:hypothetical protein
MNHIAYYTTQQLNQIFANNASTVATNFVQTNSFKKAFAVLKASTAPKLLRLAPKIF